MVIKFDIQGRERTTFRQIEKLGILAPTLQAHIPFLMEVVRKVQVFRISKFKQMHIVLKEPQRKQDAKAPHTRALRTTKRLASTNVQVLLRLQSSL